MIGHLIDHLFPDKWYEKPEWKNHMSEAKMKASLVDKIRKQYNGSMVFRHEDKLTHGIPDISVTCQNRTVWLEAKWANPEPEFSGIQTLTCLRLAGAGTCFYVIYDKKHTRTYVTHPLAVKKGDWRDAEIIFEGFAHQDVAEWLSRFFIA